MKPIFIEKTDMFIISVGKSRYDRQWKNKKIGFSDFVECLKKPVRTSETLEEYKKIKKEDQDKIKDVGGFVGGWLKDGRRANGNVLARQLVTLDADFGTMDLWESLDDLLPYAYVAYTTHKHTREKPRFRICIPINREVTAEEYEAIARKVAEEIGINYFDDTTYQPTRLMYYPSCSIDGEYISQSKINAKWLQAEEYLAKYPDWRDTSFWAISDRTKSTRKKTASKQGDPLKKQGAIGGFCRAYTIEETIDIFLSEVYEPCTVSGRYTYKRGSTSAGLVLYEDKFAYSNHSTDPASGILCNAFDLVRIHKFGELDKDEIEGTKTEKLPSYKAMLDFAIQDERTKAQLIKEQFDDEDEEEKREKPKDRDWQKQLEFSNAGILKNNQNNARIILEYDEKLSVIAKNTLTDRIGARGDLPWKRELGDWNDSDSANLAVYTSRKYKVDFSKEKLNNALVAVAESKRFHPIRDYFARLPNWDNKKRVETLLIDYLGAEDCEYVKAVTKITLVGAVARVMEPGIKFDTTLVLCGGQGIGKSTLVSKLAVDWFSDSLNLTDIKDKTAAEKLQGYWILELGELAGMGKAGIKTLRNFLTRTNDSYRAAYGRFTQDHKRQCIFIGTTNSVDGYLNDTDGGRRFLPVDVTGESIKKPWHLNEEDIGQIWAEAYLMYLAGEPLILTGDIAKEAKRRQKVAIEKDPLEEMVQTYLDKPIPLDWYKKDIAYRLDFLNDMEKVEKSELMQRDFISLQEIWVEAFNAPLSRMQKKDSYRIKAIMERMEGWENDGKYMKRVGTIYGRQKGYRKLK